MPTVQTNVTGTNLYDDKRYLIPGKIRFLGDQILNDNVQKFYMLQRFSIVHRSGGEK